LVAKAASERLARAADLVRDVVSGFLVDEPKPTSQPIDTPQAKGNIEAIHHRDVAVPTTRRRMMTA
jgi:hypothetical protein